ncbi:MAG: hypothetical protein KKH41_01255 [Candidatus Thermoplasmatota archaeon]|nr:hypothetical protein [Euryarchaeota archaeon]MBU4033083.1 hypothetical protein [Candidatus Thermoplasmatota archaeon]MBU4072317.1 hypothetical protein [Candidatus Thermoplasmatota archaeon]MBU4143363.1 hypothetical protein [Candidatus Thermoplasmatota archaeon]MBU4591189.1 hypothetical protein [Candidatus Thermoplasmatota archaeon]
MDLFSHVLWTSVLGRNRLWHDEAILFALLPDAGYFLIMLYVLFGTPMNVNFADAMVTLPKGFMVIYYLLHSFVVFGVTALAVWKLKPKLLPALSAWFFHICMDIPFHDGVFGTRILYPLLPNFYIGGMSWGDYRVLAGSYFLLLATWFYLEMRELRKHRRRDNWLPDWIDRLEHAVGGLINPKPIPTAHAEGGDNARTPDRIPGEDRVGTGENQYHGPGAVPPPEAG